ncbi:beta-1,3-glucosyltransferase-like isoform X1 [Arapaima gigas]
MEGWSKDVAFGERLSECVSELHELVFVIQSQRNCFQAQRAEERRVKLLQQAVELKANPPPVLLLHNLTEDDGSWSISPIFFHRP